MYKVIVALPIALTLIVAAENTRTLDCIDSFQQDIAEILYAKPDGSKESIEELTQKINTILEKECDINTTEHIQNNPQDSVKNDLEDKTHTIILDTTKESTDCIENFSNDVKDLLYSNEKTKDKKVRIIIKGDGNNCTKELEK